METQEEELTAPLHFKLFVPCKTNQHEQCCGKNKQAQCACYCHSGIWEGEDENETTPETHGLENAEFGLKMEAR